MSYNIPNKVKILKLNEEQKVSLNVFMPEVLQKIRNGIITMVFFGNDLAPFKMRMNVYYGPTNNRLLVSSLPVSSTDIVRGEHWFCELRFDFEGIKALANVTSGHLVEFEVYDGYLADNTHFIGLVYDFDGDYENIRNNYSLNKLDYIPIRSSLFTEKE